MLNSTREGKLCLLPVPLLLALACADARTSFSTDLELGALEAPVVRGSEEIDVADHLAPVDGEVVISEYKLPALLDAVVNPTLPTELWASVYRPAVLDVGRRYPLIVLMHGNHGTCGRGAAPRRDDNIQYSVLGTCPADYVVVPNHRGYDYLGRDLAARNYLVVSINTNRGINGVPAPDAAGDEFVIGPRARLLLRHLEQLSHWDAGTEPTPAEVGVDLAGHIDFSEVGLFGHSRGGEGVRLAYREYRRSDSPWPALIESPVNFRGIFELAPTDEPIDGTFINAWDTPWAVLLPACDWDLRELPGVRPFDRMLSYQLSGDAEAAPFFKAFYHVWGANHNFYNSEWQVADAGASGTVPGCLNHTPLFDPVQIGSAEQRETGRFAVAAFFTANVGVDRDESGNAVFDPATALPVSYPVNRGYHPGGNIALGDAADEAAYSLVLEDFLAPTGMSSYGLPNETGGALTVRHTQLPVHASSAVALIEDVVASPSTFFQSNWAPMGAGFDLGGYDYLDLRVDRSTTAVPNVPATFLVELVNADDSRSGSVPIDEFVDLLPPPRGFTGRTLQTLRIPLGAFEGATLEAVRAVRFTFTTPFEAGILLSNIRATRATTLGATEPAASVASRGFIATSPTLQTPARAPRISGAVTEAALEPDLVVTGNSIVGVVRRGTSHVEVTLESTHPFELRPKNLVLSIGNLTSREARHPTGDLHTVQFVFAREAFDRLGAQEPVRVDYGSSSPVAWDFGLLVTALGAD
jgi:hypothetical protein